MVYGKDVCVSSPSRHDLDSMDAILRVSELGQLKTWQGPIRKDDHRFWCVFVFCVNKK